MSAIHGKSGSVKLASNAVLDITEWSMDISRDTKEDTAFGDGSIPWRSYVSGLNGATGKLTGNVNMGDTTGQFALWTSLTSDTPLSATLGTASTHGFAVSLLVTKFSVKSNVDDLETVEWDFQVSGAPTYS